MQAVARSLCPCIPEIGTPSNFANSLSYVSLQPIPETFQRCSQTRFCLIQ